MNPDPTPTAATQRILVPVTAGPGAHWAVRHLLQRREAWPRMEVVFVHVGAPVTDWQVLQFRTHDEILRFQRDAAQALADHASRPLREAGIACRAYFKQGPVLRTLLDIADELQCARIVLPFRPRWWSGLLSRGIVQTLLRRDGEARVVLVDRDGREVPRPSGTPSGGEVRWSG